MVESDEKTTLLTENLKASDTSLYKLAKVTDTHNSSCGMVIFLRGATLDLVLIKFIKIFPLLSTDRAYKHAP